MPNLYNNSVPGDTYVGNLNQIPYTTNPTSDELLLDEFTKWKSKRTKSWRHNHPTKTKYIYDVKNILYEEDVYRMFKDASDDEERNLIAIAWLTGARCEEILAVKRGHLEFGDDYFRIRLTTLKLRKGRSFHPGERTLRMNRPKGIDSSLYIEHLKQYCDSLQLKADDLLIPYGQNWAYKRIKILGLKVLNKRICLMHFRHSCLTHLASSGQFGIMELAKWKGSDNPGSVKHYLVAKEISLDLYKINRSKFLNYSANITEHSTDVNPPTQDDQIPPAVTPINPEESHSTEVSSEVNPEPRTEPQSEPKPAVAIEIKKEEKKEELASSQSSDQSAESKI